MTKPVISQDARSESKEEVLTLAQALEILKQKEIELTDLALEILKQEKIGLTALLKSLKALQSGDSEKKLEITIRTITELEEEDEGEENGDTSVTELEEEDEGEENGDTSVTELEEEDEEENGDVYNKNRDKFKKAFHLFVRKINGWSSLELVFENGYISADMLMALNRDVQEKDFPCKVVFKGRWGEEVIAINEAVFKQHEGNIKAVKELLGEKKARNLLKHDGNIVVVEEFEGDKKAIDLLKKAIKKSGVGTKVIYFNGNGNKHELFPNKRGPEDDVSHEAAKKLKPSNFTDTEDEGDESNDKAVEVIDKGDGGPGGGSAAGANVDSEDIPSALSSAEEGYETSGELDLSSLFSLFVFAEQITKETALALDSERELGERAEEALNITDLGDPLGEVVPRLPEYNVAGKLHSADILTIGGYSV